MKHNKHELLELIEQEGSQPLTMESIRNLDALGGAHNALCLLHPDRAEAEHWEHTESVGPGKPAAHP